MLSACEALLWPLLEGSGVDYIIHSSRDVTELDAGLDWTGRSWSSECSVDD